jgi:hypothetical protein
MMGVSSKQRGESGYGEERTARSATTGVAAQPGGFKTGGGGGDGGDGGGGGGGRGLSAGGEGTESTNQIVYVPTSWNTVHRCVLKRHDYVFSKIVIPAIS